MFAEFAGRDPVQLIGFGDQVARFPPCTPEKQKKGKFLHGQSILGAQR